MMTKVTDADYPPVIVEEVTLHGFTAVLGCFVPCSLTITRVVGKGYALVFRCRFIGACHLEFILCNA